MLYNVFKILISVRAKLFFGFFAMAALVIMLGGYAYFSVRGAEKVVIDTYDRPMMAINYARSASQVLAELKIEAQEVRTQQAAGIEVDGETFQELRERFDSDLKIARERSIAPRAEALFDEVDKLRSDWRQISNGLVIIDRNERLQKANALYKQMAENLDIIVELQTNQSFRNREAAINRMNKIKDYSLWAMVAALLLTVIFSAWIAVTIIYPLNAAASAARKIAAGNLDADIPRGGDDETGALLKTMAGMQNNIRARMEKETSSRALAQTRLAESLENSKDAVMLADAQGRIIVANGELKSMFQHLDGLNLIGQPYDNFFEVTGVPRTIGYTLHAEQNELQSEDGRWARINASDTHEGGRLMIWTAITQSKEREANLREARDAARKADEAKTAFLAAMSHELRTPLNAVIGFSDIISSETLGEIGNEDYVKMAGLISESGAHLLHIVTDVLSIADGRSPEDLQISRAPVDLNTVLSFCLTVMKEKAKDSGVRILGEIPETPSFVIGDTVRLKQIFLNVMGNAVKYNKATGFVKLSVTSFSDAVRIDILDTGIGIPEAELERIFDPFVQVDNSKTRQFEGVGLGLSIVNKWLTQHGGRIKIQSALGEGTCVSITLPLMNLAENPVLKAIA